MMASATKTGMTIAPEATKSGYDTPTLEPFPNVCADPKPGSKQTATAPPVCEYERDKYSELDAVGAFVVPVQDVQTESPGVVEIDVSRF